MAGRKKDVSDAKEAVGVDAAAVGQDDIGTPDVGVPVDEAVAPAEPTEAEATSLLAFVDWANGEEVADLEQFVALGLIDQKHSLTDEGKKLLDDQKIGWRQMYFIRIGIPMTLTDGTKIMDGSSLVIVNGGYDQSAGSRFWLCFAGEQLPVLTVYQHSLHQFWDAAYPINQKMEAKYVKAGE